MKLTHSSKPVLALLSLALIFTGSASATAANHTAEYPPVPGEVSAPEPGNSGKIIGEVPPLDDTSKVVIPRAVESTEVLNVRVFAPSVSAIADLNNTRGPIPAVQVTNGVVLGGVSAGEDVARVQVSSKSKTTSEIQAPAGTPTVISLGGYTSGQRVVVTITQGGKTVNLGTFIASDSGKLVLPAATLTGTANQEFSFKVPGSAATKVVLRPTAPEPGFSTLKVKFKKR